MSTRRPKPETTPSSPKFALETLLGHTFKTPALLKLALTHSSLAFDHSQQHATPRHPRHDNEQLEFLGDAVLGLITAEFIYAAFPDLHEGDLTRLRAALVSSRHLAHVAARLDLGAHLLLGKGEEHTGGRRKPAILADAVEAIVAALYLDAGLPPARNFIETHIIAPSLAELTANLSSGGGQLGDHKSALQEFLQSTSAGQPRYVVTNESGPDHQKSFHVEVRIAGEPVAHADGPTKKEAQQKAAALALKKLKAEPIQKPAAPKKSGAPER